MIQCPHCGADNWPEQNTCYACGGDLRADSRPGAMGASKIPTQPVRVTRGTVRATQDTSPPVRPPVTSTPYQRPASAPVPPRSVGGQAFAPPPAVPTETLHERLDSSRRWRYLAALLGLVVLCVGIFAVWIIGVTVVNGVRRTASQLQTRVPQTLPELPGVPEPTATEAYIPSPWPTPTRLDSAATAAPDAQPTPSPDWQRYLTAECSAALSHLRSANQYLADNPGAPLEAAWRDDLSAAVGEMRAYCGSLDSASPVPELVREAHRNFTRATEEYDAANQLFKESLDEFNPGKMIDAVARYRVAVKYLTQALEELDKIGE